MTLYLDTSALVKLYVREQNSELVAKRVEAAESVATNILAFVETRSAFARLLREAHVDESQFDLLKTAFANDWQNYVRVGTLPQIIERAADFSAAFSLRAYDSVHLASADYLQRATGKQIHFGCFDRKLKQAAQALGMALLD